MEWPNIDSDSGVLVDFLSPIHQFNFNVIFKLKQKLNLWVQCHGVKSFKQYLLMIYVMIS